MSLTLGRVPFDFGWFLTDFGGALAPSPSSGLGVGEGGSRPFGGAAEKRVSVKFPGGPNLEHPNIPERVPHPSRKEGGDVSGLSGCVDKSSGALSSQSCTHTTMHMLGDAMLC